MKIVVVGLGCQTPDFLDKLSDTFSAKITFDKFDLPRDAFYYERGQWNAEKTLNHLKIGGFTADKVLGVVDVDIVVRGLNFVFGLSEMNGRNCLLSLYRLHPAGQGKKEEKLFEDRVLKEATHELGHSFGLEHCADRRCVMSFSNSIEEVDAKGSRFCESCTKQLALK
jgi:archaemetzincin